MLKMIIIASKNGKKEKINLDTVVNSFARK